VKPFATFFFLATVIIFANSNKSQPGQTIDHVIVDLGKLVQISSSTFNAYVALSYGKGRDTIRLRDLDNNLLARHSSKDLCEEELDWRNLLKR
jgi:hypothetical protein